MKKILTLFFLINCFCGSLYAAEINLCTEEGLTGRPLRLCNRLCIDLQCGDKNELYTTKRCAKLTEKYIITTTGEMPPCLPRYSEAYYANELYCYSNWRVDQIADCNPLYNPEVDLYNVIDESDGTTEYEICLMNKRMQFDICMNMMDISAGSKCYNYYAQPCYEEYDITGDNEVLQACLEGVQWEIDLCRDDIIDKFYFNYLFPSN